jgi:Zn-dependent protease
MDVHHLVQTIAIYALPVLLAITLHEAAHGYMARHFGDLTAHAQGRISLNPLRHIDVNGTIIVPLLLVTLSAGKFAFGWAKPVPVNYSALRRPKQHMALVAAAGPAVNFLMLLGWAVVLRSVIELPRAAPSAFVAQMAIAGIVVNTVIMTINLLPILPLDGGRILTGLLPRRLAWRYAKTERWGAFVLLGFIAANLLDAWFFDGQYVGRLLSPLGSLVEGVIRMVLPGED